MESIARLQPSWCVLCVLAVVFPAFAPSPGRIESLGWLAGCWQRKTGDRVLEEQWMAPRGGMMLGMSRTVRGDRVADYEAMRIYEKDDKLFFVATPSGQSTVEFEEVATTSSAITFANPAHDFPQRIIYGKGTADSLFTRIEGTVNGNVRGVDFRLKRTACGGASEKGRLREASEKSV